MHRLTRAAVAAFFRWREAEDRSRAAALLGLHPDEAAALETLEYNLHAAGPPETWAWERSNRVDLRDGLVTTILDDLTAEPEQAAAIARLCRPNHLGLAHMLGVAFCRHLERQPRAAANGNGHAPVALEPGEFPPGFATSRLREAMARRGLDVEDSLSRELRRELAGEAGISTRMVSTYLCLWKKQRACRAGQPGTGGAAPCRP